MPKASGNACYRRLKKRRQSLLRVFQLKGMVRKLWSIPFMRTCLSRASTQCNAQYSRIGWPFRQSNIPQSIYLHWLQISSSSQNILRWHDLQLKKHYEWHDFQGPGEPITGAGGAFITALHEAVLGLSSIPRKTRRNMKIRERQQRKRKRKTVRDAMAAWSNCPSAFGSA